MFLLILKQIMKQIYHSLTAMQLTTTWKEIFRHREMAKEGSASQSIKDMALAIQERRYKSDKPSLPAGMYIMTHSMQFLFAHFFLYYLQNPTRPPPIK